jgi:hypothetical protein
MTIACKVGVHGPAGLNWSNRQPHELGEETFRRILGDHLADLNVAFLNSGRGVLDTRVVDRHAAVPPRPEQLLVSGCGDEIVLQEDGSAAQALHTHTRPGGRGGS